MRGCVVLLLCTLLFILVAWWLRSWILSEFASALIEDDGPHKADVAVVMGGDDYGTRILKAAQLARAGYVPMVLVSGPIIFLGHHECDFTIDYAVKRGYPATLFRCVPNFCNSTRSETAFLGGYFREHNIRKILLVTSNFHTHRAAQLMRKQNPGLAVDVVAAPDPAFTPETWWKTRDGKKTFLYEWMKTVATWMGA